MEIRILKPRKALNKAFLKVKPNRTEIESFKTNLIQLLDRINDKESEEFHKNLVIDFLKKTYYDPNHFVNTKSRNDLVIHNTNSASGTVGVIVEAKKPTNKTEMLKASAPGDTQEQMLSKINVKAFQELVLYYLRERITQKNIEIKYLIATNINEWFIFDAHIFEKHFAQNKELVRKFIDFENGSSGGKTTDFFYEQIAKPFIAEIKHDIEFTYFDIREYEKPLRNDDRKDDNKLISLFKLLSPEHLLKLPFANDSNSLDKRFYGELLHIIGLTETKDGGKKLIERNKEGERNTGSFLENAIIQLDSLDKISRLENPSQFGANLQERLFNVGIELSITWINRILFLKLLEAQLITYHKGDKSYEFLSLDKIKDYDDLNSLFFQVLARKQNERNEDIKGLFAKVPHLNSSLFEPTEIEHSTLFISQLSNDKTIPIYSSTVIKDDKGKRRTGNINPLEYLFEFLNAYDFASEGSEEIQEDNKTLINASVLGLIFEKINGYKDGSFFTPGFITMYMCRETIRKAVVQKFNESKGWKCSDIYSLYDKIEDRNEANKIINDLKICDPAVGSGHFLVSALNEMIAIKSDLKILQDREGRRLKEYHFEVVNDELIVTDEDGELFEYNPTNNESQRIQETLFHEKQTIIENCLFGVDINPNSVKICRLRLWIELLKNAYYKNATELETLPNIDINIKCGNSLISRYPLDSDLRKILKSSKWTIDSYRLAVATYRNAKDKDVKHEMEKLILNIKQDFTSEIRKNDPYKTRIDKLANELYNKFTGNFLFEPLIPFGKNEKELEKKRKKEQEKLEIEITQLTKKIDEIKSNKIYENAFEWRFEFPEVLDDNGDFVGFDVVIGNPPYIRQEEFSGIKPYLQSQFETYAGTADLYVFFVERGIQILRQKGNFIYILPNKWMRAGYGAALRKWVDSFAVRSIVDFGDLPVFDEATTYPCILHIEKTNSTEKKFSTAKIETLDFPEGLNKYIKTNSYQVNQSLLSSGGWTLSNDQKQQLLEKIKKAGIPLGEYVNGKIYYGIKTGLNEAFVIDKTTRDRLIAEDPASEEIIKPFLAGRDIKRYQQPQSDKYLIFTRRGIEIEKYPSVKNHLAQFQERLEPKPIDYNGNNWSGRKTGSYKWYEIQDAVDYYDEFENSKVMLPDISLKCQAVIDETQFYCVNTAYIIPGLSYSDLGILNSKFVLFFYANLTQTIRGGYFRFIRQYLEQIPFIKTTILDEKVSQIIDIKKANPSADTAVLESEIDHSVYQLYNLTAEEIAIIETGVK
jgi:type II restriction/modification system DNA methylase subunit YeeA